MKIWVSVGTYRIPGRYRKETGTKKKRGFPLYEYFYYLSPYETY